MLLAFQGISDAPDGLCPGDPLKFTLPFLPYPFQGIFQSVRGVDPLRGCMAFRTETPLIDRRLFHARRSDKPIILDKSVDTATIGAWPAHGAECRYHFFAGLFRGSPRLCQRQ